jgi:hypothetical protein
VTQLSLRRVCLRVRRQVYVHHFGGHYLFLPVFFSKALVQWCMPRRWRLPNAQLERLATRVRVIARLLWTIHIDFSEAVRGGARRHASLANVCFAIGAGLWV